MNPNYVIYSLDPPEPMIATFSDIFGVEFEKHYCGEFEMKSRVILMIRFFQYTVPLSDIVANWSDKPYKIRDHSFIT